MNVPFIRVMFIVSYILVFICCCVGNSLVLIIILRNARMRTRPYVFLANLAVADLSVGIFCVLPSLSTFLSPVWLLGKVG
ncbi:hypothetical protein LOTGIDRAFT_140896 [Lottia gigantea]|uniref:G-protein coupled receptors family 1 profile domain-containing protein n=1 Tax=Lottia gigantea TaxID=225164 RepID=V4A8T9_LOTGI|nr:hypothetical protein LOTGIDRAFT_140896 [Lottia gigantea]ESP00349.1 hypothetical protein LOTGIDRAFT_140896 [Lottia gigantea]